MEELARRPSLERCATEACSSDSEAFRVRELVIEIELDDVLRAPGDHDMQTVESSWKCLVERIRSHMSQSTSVIVRGWTPQIRLGLTQASMRLQFGNLGFRCQWLDGMLMAARRGVDEEDDIPYHKITTMAKFIELVEDTTTCGNFLDGKDMNSSPPTWAKPIFDSTTAWEHTMHLRFLQKSRSKKTEHAVRFEEAAPTVIRSATWSSQGWRLVTHPGFVTFPHHDCCGMGTYVVGNSGAKIWSVMRPKRDKCPSSLKGLKEALQNTTELTTEGNYPNADIATVCLEEGDIM